MFIPDHQLKMQAEAALQASSELNPLDVAVSVTAGVVALTGYVPRLRDKYRAEDIIKRLSGVLGMANAIEVTRRTAALSEPQLARAAVAALREALPDTWRCVQPVVRRRIVTLEGQVASEAERREAVLAVRALGGIEAIVNLIALAAIDSPAADAPSAQAGEPLARRTELRGAAHGGTERLPGAEASGTPSSVPVIS